MTNQKPTFCSNIFAEDNTINMCFILYVNFAQHIIFFSSVLCIRNWGVPTLPNRCWGGGRAICSPNAVGACAYHSRGTLRIIEKAI
jgi:hypothetical protein